MRKKMLEFNSFEENNEVIKQLTEMKENSVELISNELYSEDQFGSHLFVSHF
jgi:predicted nucleic acid-binding OB-fold protein